jgi:CO/xanthine dehydrogenase FAD-binding subunit
MKPAPFEYWRPHSLDEACAMLAEADESRLIAGGQTLVPLMAMRLARPKRLIDIGRLSELAFIRGEGDEITIGATTRQRAAADSALVKTALPLLHKVLPHVGHAAIRARGTIGGSLANADPAAEIALVAVTLGAMLVCREEGKLFEIPAADFFTGPMMTVLPPTTCLIKVRFPVWRDARLGVGFQEINARASDFAFASAAAQIAVDEEGVCRRVAIGIGAVSSVPLRLDTVANTMQGTIPHQDMVRDAVDTALAGIVPLADMHASAAYRRRAAATLLVRAINEAYASARSVTAHAH